jgi:hypothetical protein
MRHFSKIEDLEEKSQFEIIKISLSAVCTNVSPAKQKFKASRIRVHKKHDKKLIRIHKWPFISNCIGIILHGNTLPWISFSDIRVPTLQILFSIFET